METKVIDKLSNQRAHNALSQSETAAKTRENARELVVTIGPMLNFLSKHFKAEFTGRHKTALTPLLMTFEQYCLCAISIASHSLYNIISTKIGSRWSYNSQTIKMINDGCFMLEHDHTLLSVTLFLVRVEWILVNFKSISKRLVRSYGLLKNRRVIWSTIDHKMRNCDWLSWRVAGHVSFPFKVNGKNWVK